MLFLMFLFFATKRFLLSQSYGFQFFVFEILFLVALIPLLCWIISLLVFRFLGLNSSSISFVFPRSISERSSEFRRYVNFSFIE